MQPPDGARTFLTTGDAYDAFMGRYSVALATDFAESSGVTAGERALDVGCGPGALTAELVRRLGAESVASCDPSPPFVQVCATRNPGVPVRQGRAEELPYDDGSFEVALAQLVLHFVSDPSAAGAELIRVLRPGGRVAVCVWDFERGMQMLRAFWDAALALDANAPDELRVMRFGRAAELAEFLTGAGFTDVVEQELTVDSTYAGFDELWRGFLAGIGPAGSYCVALPETRQADLRAELFERVGSPSGAFTLQATARAAVGTRPG
ncbi:MAG: methyltransferase domain-containing protein [Kineosporiaceae bacterium]|nr:methyltransferase domain-containing protein [Kineosporiaceae bacterium]MBK8074141.1 methyltransferase domain-containing protein [Kineosporiaceae bacterium]